MYAGDGRVGYILGGVFAIEIGHRNAAESPARRERQISKDPSDSISMEINLRLDPNTKVARARTLSILNHDVHGVPTRKGTATTSRPPPTPEVERTGISIDDSVTRQCALVGDSPNDEQWSDDLSSHQITMSEYRAVHWEEKHTNLSLSEDG